MERAEHSRHREKNVQWPLGNKEEGVTTSSLKAGILFFICGSYTLKKMSGSMLKLWAVDLLLPVQGTNLKDDIQLNSVFAVPVCHSLICSRIPHLLRQTTASKEGVRGRGLRPNTSCSSPAPLERDWKIPLTTQVSDFSCIHGELPYITRFEVLLGCCM